jgi:hypothetical protein
MEASANDRLSPIAGIAWDFGDGVHASGNLASHCYAKPGPQRMTVSATDGAGNAASTTRNLTVRRPRRTAIGCLALSSPTVALRPRQRADEAPGSATARFAISHPARLKAVVQRRRGRRWRDEASLRKRVRAGAATLRIRPRRFGGRRLPTGRYRLRISARRASATARFEVSRR